MSDLYSKYEKLEIDRPSERILRITFNRPERLNAVDAKGHQELCDIWRDIDRDNSVNAVLLRGIGRAFSAGGDFDMIDNIIADSKYRWRALKEARDLVYNIINCSKPIVSAIHGPAVGAGLVAGVLSDVSIAAKDARIIDGHTRLGVAAGDVAAIIWPLLCGMAKAKYHLLLCEPMTGEEAERMGLVSLSVEAEELQDKAMEVAERLAKGAPAAIRLTKYSLNNWLRMAGPTFDASTAYEFLGFAGEEAKEGLASHREKRPPNFDLDNPL
ncbi:MAG: enoyl-CoA hydratase/isomerase family protein [Alphaproteobacteria bacterium]|jgi:enoyl-CoA hydratase